MTGPTCFAEQKATVCVCGIIWGLLRPRQGLFLHVGVGYEWVGSLLLQDSKQDSSFSLGV